MLISTYFKENAGQTSRAEVCKNEAGNYYYIDFYDFSGEKVRTEAFVGRSLQYVEDAAENWTLGIKVLLG